MEDYILTQAYMTPLWIVNALNFGNFARKNFKESKKDIKKLYFGIYWSMASACAIGMAATCASNGLERVLK